MIHVTSSFRPEVVLFGREHRFSTPCALDAGSSLVVRVTPDDQVIISKISADKPLEKLTVANDVDAVIHAVAQLGGNYCDVVQMLQSAKAKDALASRFEVDAVPRGGRPYRRTLPSAGQDASGEQLGVASPEGGLFTSHEERPKPKKPAAKSDDAEVSVEEPAAANEAT
jgi:hypothetical protein